MNAVETLLWVSSCDSTISSMLATLEEVRQSQANNPNPIPVEVVTHEAWQQQGQDMNPVAMGVTPDKDEESQMGTRAGHEVTDQKQTTEEREMYMTDGFLMPSWKHITYAKASSPKSEMRIGMRNQYEVRMQSSEETSLDEGAWTPGMETCLIIEGKRVQSHYAHRI